MFKIVRISLLALLIIAPNAYAGKHEMKQVVRFHQFIPNEPNFRVDPKPVKRAKAKLVRTADSLELTLNSRDLPSGAYSVWMRAFNRPDLCVGGEDVKGSLCSRWQDVAPNPFPCVGDETGSSSCSVFWVAATMVGEDGKAHVSATLDKSTWPGMVLLGADNMNNDKKGVWNMLGSELHVILRYHGPSAAPQGPFVFINPETGRPNPLSDNEKEAYELLGRQLYRVAGNCNPGFGEAPGNCEDQQLAVFPPYRD